MHIRHLALWACLLTGPAWASPATDARHDAARDTQHETQHENRYDAARDDYEVGHYDKAFVVFAELADHGHCAAARIAREMVLAGKPLYGIEFRVAPQRLARWAGVPNCTVLAKR